MQASSFRVRSGLGLQLGFDLHRVLIGLTGTGLRSSFYYKNLKFIESYSNKNKNFTIKLNDAQAVFKYYNHCKPAHDMHHAMTFIHIIQIITKNPYIQDIIIDRQSQF